MKNSTPFMLSLFLALSAFAADEPFQSLFDEGIV